MPTCSSKPWIPEVGESPYSCLACSWGHKAERQDLVPTVGQRGAVWGGVTPFFSAPYGHTYPLRTLECVPHCP